MNATITHVGFADESYWNKGRFRSLGLVTATVRAVDLLNSELRSLLGGSNVCEFKWTRLKGAKERFAAEKLCRFTVEKACTGQLRVDVLVWDIEDSRHRVPGRDDIANLERLYYHLFRNVLRARWPDDAIWRLHPDEHTALDWETVKDCLEAKSTSIEVDRTLFPVGGFKVRLRREFGIEDIQPVLSGDHPLLQLADLFAGLAVFSRDRFADYQKWLKDKSQQVLLFEDADHPSYSSRSSQERFQVLKSFNQACKQKTLCVSLKTTRGLWTPDPKNPINFWMYEPQHPEDKAPLKRSR